MSASRSRVPHDAEHDDQRDGREHDDREADHRNEDPVGERRARRRLREGQWSGHNMKPHDSALTLVLIYKR